MHTQAPIAPTAPYRAICAFSAPTNNIDDTELSLVCIRIDDFSTQDAPLGKPVNGKPATLPLLMPTFAGRLLTNEVRHD